jgi:hypothetical protein
MGADKQHLKMWITDGRHSLEAVWWNAGEQSVPSVQFDLAFVPQISHYNGKRLLQLKFLDWRPAAGTVS